MFVYYALLIFIVLLFLVELDNFGLATLLMIVTCSMAQYYHIVDILGCVSKNYAWTLVYILVYLLLGLSWSIGKWVLFLQEFNRKRIEVARTTKNFTQRYKKTLLSKRPKASDYKGTIIAWMIWWPVSMIGTILNEPIRKLLNFIYDQISGLYQTLSNKIVLDINEEPTKRRNIIDTIENEIKS